MQKKSLILMLLAMTFVMLGIPLYMVRGQNANTHTSFAQLLLPDGNSIKPWYNEEDGTYYFFLPSYAEQSGVRFVTNEGETFDFAGVTLTSGDYIGGLDLRETYNVTGNRSRRVYKTKFLQSKNVATVYIATVSGSMDQIYNSKDHKEVAKVTVLDTNGITDYSSADSRIKGRGNSTWAYYDKKPFSIITSGQVSILGMEPTSKYVLLANYIDPSGIRNALVYETARMSGMENVPEYRFVDVYLNGEYNGMYLICQSYDRFYERNEQGTENLFLYTAELPGRRSESRYIISAEQGEALVDVVFPKTLEKNDKEYVDDYIQSLDEAICSGNENIGDFLDLYSWVRKYLIDEIFENYDAGLSSSYFYVYKNSESYKAYAGPLWDYDNIIGVASSGNNKNPRCLYADQQYRTKTERLLWYHELNTNPVFYNEMVNIFKEIYVPLMEVIISETIYDLEDEIYYAKQNDNLRWGADSGEGSEYLIGYLKERLEFLESVWLQGEDYRVVTYYNGENTDDFLRIYLQTGDSISEHPEYMEMLDSTKKWFIDGTSEEYDFSLPVDNDIILTSKLPFEESSGGLLSKVKAKKRALAIVFSVFVLWMLPCGIRICKRINKGVA